MVCIACFLSSSQRGQCASNILPSLLTVDHLAEVANMKFDPKWEETFKGSGDYKWFVGPDGKAFRVLRDGRGQEEED